MHADPSPVIVSPTTIVVPASTSTPLPDERLALGDRALLQGDFAAAQIQYREALAAGVQPDRAAFFLARAQLDGGDPAGARATLQNLLAAQPSGAFALRATFLLGEAASTQEDWATAASAYQSFLVMAQSQPVPVTGLDALVLERIGDAYLAAGNTDLSVQSYDAASTAASQSESLRLQEKAGDALLQAGLQEPALTIYDRVLTSVSSDWARARLLRKIGGILIALGRTEEGYNQYQAALEYPLSFDAYQCLWNLVEAGFSPDDLTRGIIDYNAEMYDPAILAFNRYLEATPAEPARALYYRGLAFQSLENAQSAVDDLKAAAAYGSNSGVWDDALFELAYTLWAWQDDFAGASAAIAGLADTAPAHPRAPEALNAAARIAERGGDLSLAARLWARLADGYPASEYAVDGRHWAGISLFRTGDFSGAETIFAKQTGATDLSVRARALFWAAKARSARGDTAGAQSSFAEAAAADPTGYYSERARDLLAGRKAFSSTGTLNFTFDLDAEYRAAEAWLRQRLPLTPVAGDPTTVVLNDARLARGRLLWDLGLYDGAMAEFSSLRQSLAADPAASLYLSRYLYDTGCYPDAILAARQVLDAVGMTDVENLSAPAYFSHVRFGTYFAELLVPQAVLHGFDPLFLFSVVRQESRFSVNAVSPASAHGLMQLIPSTAESMAARLGMNGYTQGDLYRPVINVQLGSTYLGLQRDSFDGDLFSALAAYNAGPGNAAIWSDLANGNDDLLLEIIRYDETRKYIRNIYEQYVIYRDVYAGN